MGFFQKVSESIEAYKIVLRNMPGNKGDESINKKITLEIERHVKS